MGWNLSLFRKPATLLQADGRETLELIHCQWMLACWWLGIGFALIVVLIAQTMQGTYRGEFERAWSWLIPTLIPTFSVIVGGIVHAASSTTADFRVTREIYRLAKWLSIAYLVLLFLTAAVVNIQAQMAPIQWLEASKLWLTPLNAPVGIVLGVFFASSQSESSRTAVPAHETSGAS